MNLYSQQGLEAYIPEEILSSRATQLVKDNDQGMLGVSEDPAVGLGS